MTTTTTRITARKGVSPLIAAVLLIAFTMAVAAILTAWVTTFTQEQTDAVSNQSEQITQCAGGVIQILDTSSSNSELNITIANVGNVDFNNATITVLGSGSVVGSDFTNSFNSGETTFSRISLSGSPDKVRVAAQDCAAVSATQNNP